MNKTFPSFDKMFTPHFDVSALATVQQRNFEAFAAAGQCVASAFEILFKRQAELIETHLTAQVAAVKEAFTPGKAPMDMQKQTDLMRAQTTKAITDAQELTTIATTAATSAFEILRKRTEEGVAELTAIAQAA